MAGRGEQGRGSSMGTGMGTGGEGRGGLRGNAGRGGASTELKLQCAEEESTSAKQRRTGLKKSLEKTRLKNAQLQEQIDDFANHEEAVRRQAREELAPQHEQQMSGMREEISKLKEEIKRLTAANATVFQTSIDAERVAIKQEHQINELEAAQTRNQEPAKNQG